MPEKILVTSALPYANGPIHLGHLVEYLQTDVWVRYLKMAGRQVRYVCASDTHGAPIEINAGKVGKTPDAFVHEWHLKQKQDFADFLVDFDTFYTTNSPENRRWSEEIYRRLKAGGHIVERPLEQWYCEKDGRFLPDRFVKGTCPACGATDQYGDVCEVCGKSYPAAELKAPYCALCRTAPVRRTSQHLFFKLGDFAPMLQEFVRREGTLHPTVRNSVRAWLDGGLEDWCVSRDGPYFGFEIPDAPGKYFYVWLDAPIGYIAASEHVVGAEHTLDLWGRDQDTRIVHFIGKDIIYFHALFWPAMLEGAGLRLPQRIQVHGMLTLGGEKLSKSRGKLVTAREYLDAGLDPEALRWFYASNLTSGPNDVPLAKDEIRDRVNAELVKTLANYVARVMSPLKKDLGGVLGPVAADEPSRALWARALEASRRIGCAFEEIELREACSEIVALGFEANKYLQERAPWSKRKKGDEEGARADLSLCANIAYVLGVWLKPIVPKIAAHLEAMLGGTPLDPARLGPGAEPPLAAGTTLGELGHLAAPLEDEKLAQIWPAPADAAAAELAAGKAEPGGKGGKAEGAKGEGTKADKGAKAEPGAKAAKAAAPAEPAVPGIIAYDDFAKVELKVGRILTAEKVAGADKLLKLSVDVGEAAPRTIVAGIALHYAPETLPGKHVAVVANLAPRKLRGVESHGMLLAAGGDGGAPLVLLDAAGVAPGTHIR